jgi:hypothetical protein
MTDGLKLLMKLLNDFTHPKPPTMIHQPDSPANPIPQEVREKINEYADKYAFRVPYDGTNNFYDEEALKHFLAGAEFGYSLALPRIKELEEANERLRTKLIKVGEVAQALAGKKDGEKCTTGGRA